MRENALSPLYKASHAPNNRFPDRFISSHGAWPSLGGKFTCPQICFNVRGRLEYFDVRDTWGGSVIMLMGWGYLPSTLNPFLSKITSTISDPSLRSL